MNKRHTFATFESKNKGKFNKKDEYNNNIYKNEQPTYIQENVNTC